MLVSPGKNGLTLRLLNALNSEDRGLKCKIPPRKPSPHKGEEIMNRRPGLHDQNRGDKNPTKYPKINQREL